MVRLPLITNHWMAVVIESGFSWNSDYTYRAILLATGYTPSVDHNYYSEVSGFEMVNATNYTKGGKTLTSLSVTEDDSNNKGIYNAANLTWSSINNGKVDKLVVLRWKVTDTPNSEIVCVTSGSGFPHTTDGTDLIISFPNGVYIGTGG